MHSEEQDRSSVGLIPVRKILLFLFALHGKYPFMCNFGCVLLIVVTSSTQLITHLLLSTWRPYPCIMANQLFAFIACVREQVVITGDAIGAVVRLDVLAAIQRFFAVVTVKSVSHCNFLQI